MFNIAFFTKQKHDLIGIMNNMLIKICNFKGMVIGGRVDWAAIRRTPCGGLANDDLVCVLMIFKLVKIFYFFEVLRMLLN